MNEWDARLLAIVNRAVREAQDENRRKGIPNVYVINGTLLWQMPDGSITTVDPMHPANLATNPSNNETTEATGKSEIASLEMVK